MEMRTGGDAGSASMPKRSLGGGLSASAAGAEWCSGSAGVEQRLQRSPTKQDVPHLHVIDIEQQLDLEDGCVVLHADGLNDLAHANEHDPGLERGRASFRALGEHGALWSTRLCASLAQVPQWPRPAVGQRHRVGGDAQQIPDGHGATRGGACCSGASPEACQSMVTTPVAGNPRLIDSSPLARAEQQRVARAWLRSAALRGSATPSSVTDRAAVENPVSSTRSCTVATEAANESRAAAIPSGTTAVAPLELMCKF
ncbi:hypothetical protein [Rhodococcus sp. X156]|uniref:hypothetical protein n=1 Tax=Rhodococcus sp. X156 TaxID=2499145 RepID=UPI001F493C7F|nr:hypothetical protein [Rhodococcus sp. X156]